MFGVIVELRLKVVPNTMLYMDTIHCSSCTFTKIYSSIRADDVKKHTIVAHPNLSNSKFQRKLLVNAKYINPGIYDSPQKVSQENIDQENEPRVTREMFRVDEQSEETNLGILSGTRAFRWICD